MFLEAEIGNETFACEHLGIFTHFHTASAFGNLVRPFGTQNYELTLRVLILHKKLELVHDLWV